MKVLVTGASGLLGSELCRVLKASGHEVRKLVRGEPRHEDEFRWNPRANELDPSAMREMDAVIHLAGESIASGRWSAEKKRAFWESRVGTTQLLANAIQESGSRVRVFVSASAVGAYGDRGDTLLTEDSPPGEGFLANLVQAWEAEVVRAGEKIGARIALCRFGIVLSTRGGALKKMLPAFRWGVGGKLGSGRQFMSWVSLRDAVSAIQFALEDTRVSGAINVVAPHPIPNVEFTKALAQALHRWVGPPVPAGVLRVLFGEMAYALLLASCRAEPKRLLELGFEFRDSELRSTLTRIIQEKR